MGVAVKRSLSLFLGLVSCNLPLALALVTVAVFKLTQLF